MLFRKFDRKLFNEEEDSGAGGTGAEDQQKPEGAAGDPPADKKDDKSGDSKHGISEKEHELLREVMEKKQKLKESQAALEKLQQKTKELETQMERYQGIDLDEVKKLLSAKTEEEQKRLEEKGEFDKVKQQMREAHQTEVKTLKQQIEEITNKLKSRESTIDELSIGHAFAGSKYISEKLVLPPSKARTIFGPHFERDEQGRIVGYDKPVGAAGRAPLVNADGDPLSFDEALGRLVDRDPDKDQIIRSTTRPGAGSGTTSGTPQAPASDERGLGRIKAALDAGQLKGSRLKLAK